MKALFITTHTKDVDSLVNAWNCFNEVPAGRVIFNYNRDALPIDNGRILREATEFAPEIILYVGGAGLDNMPSLETFIKLRNLAPSINLCCDAADEPWHQFLNVYKKRGCFDLQVTLDGVHEAPVDFVTVTPVDPTLFESEDPVRDLRCGFSGNYGPPPRGPIVRTLFQQKILAIRRRDKNGDYEGHIAFTRRCEMILNCAWRGSSNGFHVKGRVLEAARAGCALLENEGSPTFDWIPKCYTFPYETVQDARKIIRHNSLAKEMGEALRDHVKDRFHPREIYGSILKEINLVVPPHSK